MNEHKYEETDSLNSEIQKLRQELDYWTKEIQDLETLCIRKSSGPYLEFEVHLAEHCNLNSQGCDHFSPIAAPGFADYKTVCRDFLRMSELFGADIKSINLLGGEPLLNKDVESFMVAARKYFPDTNSTEIRLVTNGILLPSMPDRFWRTCQQFQIHVAITRYPINLDYGSIFERGKSFSVEMYYYDAAPEEKSLYRVPLKLSGGLDAKRSFYKCASANTCCLLKEGRLYTCTLIPNICHFNNYFGTDLPVTPEDSIDIHEARTKEEIFSYLSKPRRFCRFCDSESKVYQLKWTQSEKRMEEWMAEEQ